MPVEEEITKLQEQVKHLRSIGTLEEQLIEAKKNGDEAALRKIKDKLRDARQTQRENRSGAATPAVLEASTVTRSTGSEDE